MQTKPSTFSSVGKELNRLPVEVVLQLQAHDLERLEAEHGSRPMQFRTSIFLAHDESMSFRLNFPLDLKKYFRCTAGRGFEAILSFRIPGEKNGSDRLVHNSFCTSLITKKNPKTEFFDCGSRAESWPATFTFDAEGYLNGATVLHVAKNHSTLMDLAGGCIIREMIVFAKYKYE